MMPAHTTNTLFSRTTMVKVNIKAPITLIWDVLCDLDNYATWNPTIIKAKGQAALASKVELVTTLAPEKTFTLRVKVFEPTSKLVLGNMMGNRTILLTQDGQEVLFSMTEVIKGPLLPLFVKFIPSFDESFDQFAKALKVFCEKDH